jgi:hypothetical protein
MTTKRLVVCKLRVGRIALAILFALCWVNLAKAQLPICNLCLAKIPYTPKCPVHRNISASKRAHMIWSNPQIDK